MVDRKVYMRTKIHTGTEVEIGLGYGVEILLVGLSLQTQVYLETHIWPGIEEDRHAHGACHAHGVCA